MFDVDGAQRLHRERVPDKSPIHMHTTGDTPALKERPPSLDESAFCFV
jgi:hypothetical protein